MPDAAVELPLLAARLKAAGAVGIRTQMVAGLRGVAKQAVPLLQQSARARLPKKGGLNEFVAKQKIKTSVRTTGRTSAVKVYSQVKGNYTNEGTWRHPVFGHRERKWAEQTDESAKGWWDDVQKEHESEFQAEAVAVLHAVAEQAMGLGI